MIEAGRAALLVAAYADSAIRDMNADAPVGHMLRKAFIGGLQAYWISPPVGSIIAGSSAQLCIWLRHNDRDGDADALEWITRLYLSINSGDILSIKAALSDACTPPAVDYVFENVWKSACSEFGSDWETGRKL